MEEVDRNNFPVLLTHGDYINQYVPGIVSKERVRIGNARLISSHNINDAIRKKNVTATEQTYSLSSLG